MDYYQKYLKYKSKYLNLKKFLSEQSEQSEQSGESVKNMLRGGSSIEKTQVYLFKAEWCPHCKSFKSTWEKLQKELNEKYEFITVDSDKDKKIIEKWGIKGFPTIIKKVGENAKEYVGPRDEESVKKFIEEN
jgi:thiol-disulfide isomerase/thioredoxin